MEFKEETIKSQLIHKGNITEYWVDEVLLPNGKKSKREIVKHAGAVAIMPFTKDGKMIFVKQFRKAIEKTILEIPAGMIDKTDAHSIETGKRELEEETGYQAKIFELETAFYTSPGFSNEFLYIYRAEDLIKKDNPLPQDEDEFLELVTLSFEEAWTAYEESLIIDAKTVFALFYWKMKKELEQKNRWGVNERMDQKTRAELRKINEQDTKERKKRTKERDKVEKDYQKQLEKEGKSQKSRKTENDKYRSIDKLLTKAIVVVSILLIIVLIIVFLI